MSVGDRWWDASAPSADTGTTDTAAAAPSKPTVQDLGNGYSLVSYTDDLGMPKSQIVPNKDAASVAAVEAAKIAAGGVGVSASISANAANQRAAVQAEIDRAKNAADAAHNAALEALAQGNAAEARRQFDISSQETQRYHSADISLRQQDQDLAKAKFGQDVYDKLANLASNPRNYMEQFFRFRGQQPPANSAQYGNTSVTGPGLMTSQQFIPNFLRSTGLSQGAAGSSPPQAGAAAPTSPREGGNMQQDIAQTYSGAADRARTYAQQIGNDPRSGAVPGSGGAFMSGATQSGVFNPQAGTRTENPFGAENSGQQYDPAQRQQQNMDFEKQVAAQHGIPNYAHGGTLRMTAPHAIVNLLSGKVAAIAGEQRGRGPQGFVPEQAKFSGKAIIEPKDTTYGTPSVDPSTIFPPDSPLIGGAAAGLAAGLAGPSTTSDTFGGPRTYIDPNAVPTSGSSGASTPTGTAAPDISAADQARLIAETGAGVHSTIGPVPTPTLPTDSGAPASNRPAPSLDGLTPPDRSTIPAGAATPAFDINPPSSGGPVPMSTLPTAPGTPATDRTSPSLIPSVNPSTGQPYTFGDMNPYIGGTPGATTGRSMPGLTPVLPSLSDQNPLLGPLPGSTNGDASRLAQPLNAWGGPLNSTPSGIGNNPTFLPENPQNDPIMDAMLKSGSFPPFLQRIFAQQAGLAGLGTNVPQATNLPPGVPLSSRLALSQMSPSELSAFQSFISAHGIDWNDYLAMVDAASPQGGSARTANPTIGFNPQRYG